MTLTAEGDPLMHRFLMALSATLLSATIATAQTGGNRHACPTTLDLTYTQIGKLDFGGPPDPKLDLTGWQPRYAPATARLLAAGIADADGSGQMQSIVPDNADSAKPGEPTLYTVWAKGQKQHLRIRGRLDAAVGASRDDAVLLGSGRAPKGLAVRNDDTRIPHDGRRLVPIATALLFRVV